MIPPVLAQEQVFVQGIKPVETALP